MNLALILLKTEPAHPLFDAVQKYTFRIESCHFEYTMPIWTYSLIRKLGQKDTGKEFLKIRETDSRYSIKTIYISKRYRQF